jgi:hypothetical protein
MLDQWWVTLFSLEVFSKFQFLFHEGEVAQFRYRQRQPSNNWLEKLVFRGIGSFACQWHAYKIRHLHYLTETLEYRQRSCLLIGYHSRPTVDLVYLMSCVQPKVVISYLFFEIPILSRILHYLGFMPSKSPKTKPKETKSNLAQNPSDPNENNFLHTLNQHHTPVLLLPGGAFEALRGYDERFQVLWKENPGYARVLSESSPNLELTWQTKGLTIIPFYTKHCEDIYWTNQWWYDTLGQKSKSLYEEFKQGNYFVFPLLFTTLLASLGFFLLPRPVQLTTVLREPIDFPWPVKKTNNMEIETLIEEVEKTETQDDRNVKENYQQPADIQVITATQFDAKVRNALQTLIANCRIEETANLQATVTTSTNPNNLSTVNDSSQCEHTASSLLYYTYLGSKTLLQNSFAFGILMSLIWTAGVPVIVTGFSYKYFITRSK